MDFTKEALKSPMLETIMLNNEKVCELKKFVNKIVSVKNNEQHHKIDGGQEEKRWYTGFSGESALEEFLGSSFVDLSIGDSKKYHVSDLSKLGFNCLNR